MNKEHAQRVIDHQRKLMQNMHSDWQYLLRYFRLAVLLVLVFSTVVVALSLLAHLSI